MIKLIVGLGNFDIKYFNTRHNVGMWYVQKLIARMGNINSFKNNKQFHGYVGEIIFKGFFIRLLMPTTYMNKSGISVLKFSKYYRIFPDEILIAHDELDLPPGRVHLKFSGGYNGHNGVKNIMKKIGNNNFYRLRIGIGRPEKKDLVKEFVLNKPSSNDKEKINGAIIKSINCIEMTILKNFSMFMQQVH